MQARYLKCSSQKQHRCGRVPLPQAAVPSWVGLSLGPVNPVPRVTLQLGFSECVSELNDKEELSGASLVILLIVEIK